MMEMKITVEAPDLAASILKLAEAIASGPDPDILTPDEPLPVASYPTAPAPAPAPAAPVSPAPVTPTQTPTPAPAPPVAAPSHAPAPTAGQTSAAPGNTPAPTVPVAGAPPSHPLDQISRAGASLVDAGKMQHLLELLGRYGVQAVTQLQPEQYGAFATELRALGAQI